MGMLACGIAAAGSLSGCTTSARLLGRATANKYANPQSGTVWVVPLPQLEPLAPEDKTVYVSFQNISDANLDLTKLLRNAASAQGWELVSNPQEATYRLRVRTQFFGEVEPESGGPMRHAPWDGSAARRSESARTRWSRAPRTVGQPALLRPQAGSRAWAYQRRLESAPVGHDY